jgi:tetratricopeptide (TPR) repeat protein
MMKKLLAAVCSALTLAACGPSAEAIRTVALSEIVRAQAAAGDVTGARETAALAVETAMAETDETGDLAIGAAAVALVWAGDVSGAVDLAEGVPDARGRALAFVLIAVAQVDRGRQEDAVANLERALDEVESLAVTGDRDALMALTAWAHAAAGDAVGTGDTLAEITGPEARAVALAWVSKIQATDGDTSAAFATAKRIPNVRNGDVDALIMIAEALATDVFRAFDSALMGIEFRPRVRALIRVAVAQAEAGESVSANRTYDLALEAARAIEYPGERARALDAVAWARAGAGAASSPRALPGFEGTEGRANYVTYRAAVSGDLWAIETLLRIALEPEADPDDARAGSERAWILGRLAAVLAEAGDKDEALATAALALELVQESPWPGHQVIPLLFAAIAQARVGEIEDALATVRRIEAGLAIGGC